VAPTWYLACLQLQHMELPLIMSLFVGVALVLIVPAMGS
jgi:hypothetical protein